MLGHKMIFQLELKKAMTDAIVIGISSQGTKVIKYDSFMSSVPKSWGRKNKAFWNISRALKAIENFGDKFINLDIW